MSVNPTPPAEPSAPAAASEPVEAPDAPIEPTASQADSKRFKATLDQEIDDLWAQAEGRAPADTDDESPAPVATAAPESAKADAPVAPETPAPPVVDREAIEREVRERIETEQRVRDEAEQRVRAEADYRQAVDVYRGPDEDYGAVNAALRQYNLSGDSGLLDVLDVTLMTPNGPKRVSELKSGVKGLTPEEAASVLNGWETARRYEDVMGDRKVQRIVDLWNQNVMQVLNHPDVDTAAVTQHADPAAQMQALRESVTARVTKRVADPLNAEIATLKAESKAKDERIESLLKERGNLTSQQRASQAASPDRPGPGGARSTGELPTPEELARMPADQAFKSGAIDRLLSSIPGGLTTRRAG